VAANEFRCYLSRFGDIFGDAFGGSPFESFLVEDPEAAIKSY
jgi:hypothetical protein